MKRAFKYFLLCIVILIGSTQLYAFNQTQNFLTTANKTVNSVTYELAFLYKPASSDHTNNLEIVGIDVEKEEYEWFSVKKFVENHQKAVSLCYAFLHQFSIENKTDKTKHYHNTYQITSLKPLYIQFSVFRL